MPTQRPVGEYPQRRKAGRALGALGARTTAATLARLSDALITTGINVVRQDRTRAGDLDVAACDPTSGTMAIFEITWRIGPDGSAEVARVEEDAHAKRAQVARVRTEIESGRATPRWPSHRPDVAGFRTHWYILTPNVLPVRTVEPVGIIVRSHQMLDRMLHAGATVSDLVDLMDEPPWPPPEITQTQWERVAYGDYVIDFDVSKARPGGTRRPEPSCSACRLAAARSSSQWARVPTPLHDFRWEKEQRSGRTTPGSNRKAPVNARVPHCRGE